MLLLRDICPKASGILLVDDSLQKDPPFEWACNGAKVAVFDGLPYEGPGLQEDPMRAIEEELAKFP